MRRVYLFFLLTAGFIANAFVSIGQLSATQEKKPLFKQVSSAQSGIHFQNIIREDLHFNYYTFMHLYMGGGVAAGDFNSDGLPDLFFTGNNVSNKLYLNKGNFHFEDVTEKAGVKGYGGFYTGVTTADVNGDELLDIYVCCSGPANRLVQSNLLFINNGDMTFTEMASSYGLDESSSHSIQSSFFDFDKDGHLDVYIANTPVDFSLTNLIVDVNKIYNNPSTGKYGGSDKLFRNDGNGTFTDVSKQTGIKPDIFFGLNVMVGDVNNDGWLDVHVSNDFNGPDFFYVNNGNGTFTESNTKVFGHTATYSMGADMGDINNDGFIDLMVLDMLPQDYKRSKTTMTMLPRFEMQKMIDAGYHRQYMHNMVQLNNGIVGGRENIFREIGYYTGVEKTDWSWSCLMGDIDLDGFNDLFVTNGILRDVTNVDSRKTQREYFQSLKKDPDHILTVEEVLHARELFPSVKLSNYLFRNKGDKTFEDISEGNVGSPNFSNGSVLVDLDGDGDLDIVCNNVNEEATLLENRAELLKRHYLKIKLKGPAGNFFGIGARVVIDTKNTRHIREQITTRGYFSAKDQTLHVGLGNAKIVDNLEVIWPDGKQQTMNGVHADREILLKYEDAKLGDQWARKEILNPFLIKDSLLLNVPFLHKEIAYDDYKHQLLLPHKLSALGPYISKGDLNKDGLEDFFISNSLGYVSGVYFQLKDGTFELSDQPALKADRLREITASIIADFNQDGYPDLYTACGSYQFQEGADELQNTIYLNSGNGELIKSDNIIPDIRTSAVTVTAFDFDGDGDEDIFIGGRVMHAKYPYPPQSYLLLNEKGRFRDITKETAPGLLHIGMVTSAVSTDFDEDGDKDLILVGEWMPLTFIENQNGRLVNVTATKGFSKTVGWWNTIEAADLNGDGKMDYVVGNLGKNYKFKASSDKPLHVFADDLDGKGVYDIVLAKDINHHLFPVRGKMCSSEQMPFINQKFPTFSAFADADIFTIYGDTALKKSVHYEASNFDNGLLINNGNGKFQLTSLPGDAQLSQVNAIVCRDINGDGFMDILLAGNLYDAEVETTRGDAGIGELLLGDGKGNFISVHHTQSGFFAPGNIKTMKAIDTPGGTFILVGENNGLLKTYRSPLKK